jgi:hypothetical protein
VPSGRQLWADHFDQDFDSVFAIQDAIAERAATALIRELSTADRDRLRQHWTEDVTAYRAYLVGWSALMRPTEESLRAAARALEEADACDPGFALAHTRLAHCYTCLASSG